MELLVLVRVNCTAAYCLYTQFVVRGIFIRQQFAITSNTQKCFTASMESITTIWASSTPPCESELSAHHTYLFFCQDPRSIGPIRGTCAVVEKCLRDV